MVMHHTEFLHYPRDSRVSVWRYKRIPSKENTPKLKFTSQVLVLGNAKQNPPSAVIFYI